jgi:hypothetical protein
MVAVTITVDSTESFKQRVKAAFAGQRQQERSRSSRSTCPGRRSRPLPKADVLRTGGEGRIEFPYNAVHVDYMLRTAA